MNLQCLRKNDGNWVFGIILIESDIDSSVGSDYNWSMATLWQQKISKPK